METSTITKMTMKQTLQDILLDISWAHLSMRYFGRSRSWLHQKLDGRNSNGGDGDFSEQEREQLRAALKDLSRRISEAADLV
jgi:hypothetical protein